MYNIEDELMFPLGLRNYIHNRTQVPAFLLNSMPKAGTNLLAKAMENFPGIFWKRGYFDRTKFLRSWVTLFVNKNARRKTHIGYTSAGFLGQTSIIEDRSITIGIDRSKLIPIEDMKNLFIGMASGSFISGHIPYTLDMANLLEALGDRSILILRDPRDVVISHANYVSSKHDHFLYDDYQKLSKSDQIMQSIIGIESDQQKTPKFLNIHDRYRNILPWCSLKINYTTFFEKLVGPKGKGSSHDQIQELENISNHLSINYSRKDIVRIASRLHGGTATFRKGTIGNWQNRFTDEHKQVFKELTGDLLVELDYESDNDW